jgi:hypothetical protein
MRECPTGRLVVDNSNDNTMWIGLQDLFNQLFSKIVSSAGKGEPGVQI